MTPPNSEGTPRGGGTHNGTTVAFQSTRSASAVGVVHMSSKTPYSRNAGADGMLEQLLRCQYLSFCTRKASKLSTSKVIVLRQMAPVRTAVDAPQQPRMPRTPGCVCQSSPILSPVFPIFHTRTKTSTQKRTAYAHSHKKNLCVSLSSPRTAESSRMLHT